MSLPIGIYIHVPYCRVICPYCDFVRARTSGHVPSEFTDALVAEIEAYDGPTLAQSIFLGGGTPSLLSTEDVGRLFESLRRRFDLSENAEITIEANPDDVDMDTLAHWEDAGINRVSLGVQSFDDDVLKFLGRNHDADTARRACSLVAEAFPNWSLDLIFGGKPTAPWHDTLRGAIALSPPHISAYSLTYEEGTAFWQSKSNAVPDDEALEQYRTARRDLVAAGYTQYEISNYAKSGFESVHNKIYWRNEAYVGFGPGAVSWLDGVRSRNAPSIRNYLHAPPEKLDTTPLDPHEIQTETLIQSFRLPEGMDARRFEERFDEPLEKTWGATLDHLCKRGLLKITGTDYCPTEAGFELNDEIGLAIVATPVNSNVENTLQQR